MCLVIAFIVYILGFQVFQLCQKTWWKSKFATLLEEVSVMIRTCCNHSVTEVEYFDRGSGYSVTVTEVIYR